MLKGKNQAFKEMNMEEGGCQHHGEQLHLTIAENTFYPVTLDVLHQIFSKFSTVLKNITFSKKNPFQALLQYMDPVSAQDTKLSLDGQNISYACCTLRSHFSKLSSLNSSTTMTTQPDSNYTPRPALRDSQPSLTLASLAIPSVAAPRFLAHPSAVAAAVAGWIAISGQVGAGNSALLVSNLNQERVIILLGVYDN
ncbi:hypothetical protein P7K49_018205, partial [Saguinus oedipus]